MLDFFVFFSFSMVYRLIFVCFFYKINEYRLKFKFIGSKKSEALNFIGASLFNRKCFLLLNHCAAYFFVLYGKHEHAETWNFVRDGQVSTWVLE